MKATRGAGLVGCLLMAGCSSGVGEKEEPAEGVAAKQVRLDAPLVWPAQAIATTNSIWVEAGASVRGSIATTLDGTNPLFDDVEVAIGLDADVEGSVMGDAIRVALGATVTGDVHYNVLTNHGTVQGELVTPLALPLPIDLPELPPIVPGSADVHVLVGGHQPARPRRLPRRARGYRRHADAHRRHVPHAVRARSK